MPDPAALLVAGAAAYANGNTLAALDLFEQAADLASGEQRTAALVNAAGMCDELGDYPRAGEIYRAVLAELPTESVKLRSAALINYSQVLQHTGDLDAAQDALEQARTVLAGTDEHREHYVACLFSLTAVALHRNLWARAAELATESLDAAIRHAPGLAGHALMNLAAAHAESGRRDLADDFAGQALAAFEAAGDANAVAETQQNLALMQIRSGLGASEATGNVRVDGVEALLTPSQEHFERAGNRHRYAIGRKALACVAEVRGDTDSAHRLYTESLDDFVGSGAILDAAAVRTCLATLDFAAGRVDTGTAHLDEAFRTCAALGLGLHGAQIDAWHASLVAAHDPRAALELAIPAALTLDAVRATFANGHHRASWQRQVVDPVSGLAFRLAHERNESQLLVDLVENQCAGVSFAMPDTSIDTERIDPTPVEPPSDAGLLPVGGPLALGSALAEVAASAGLPVSAPARIVTPTGRITLADRHTRAAERYGHPPPDETMPTWQPADPRGACVLRIADADALYLSWHWCDGSAPDGTARIEFDRLDPVLADLSAALPRPGAGVLDALRTGALADPTTELRLARHLAHLLPVSTFGHPADEKYARLFIQPSPRTAQVPWELLAVDDHTRLIDLADVAVLPPLSVVRAPGRTAHPYRPGPTLAVLDPRVPGFAANSPLGSVLGRVGPDSPLAQRYPHRIRPSDADRDWLSEQLRSHPGRLLYVGHVTAAVPETGQAETAQLHLSCDADTVGFATPLRTHRPLSAKDLLLGTHTLADDPLPGRELWPMPGRVALIACESGGDLRFGEALGLVAAAIHGGAELVTATRWTLPTDSAFAAAGALGTPLQDLVCAVDAAHDSADPVAAVAAWQRERLAAWRRTGSLADSPLLWAALATAVT